MPYTILVTPTATEDIAVAIEYYNALAADLGYRFADLVAEYFDRIAELPPASAVRYKNVRCKPMKRLTPLIFCASLIPIRSHCIELHIYLFISKSFLPLQAKGGFHHCLAVGYVNSI